MSRIKKTWYVLMASVMAIFLLNSSGGVNIATVKAASNTETALSVTSITTDQAEEIVVMSLEYCIKIGNTKETISSMKEYGYSKAVLKKAYQLVVSKYKGISKTALHYSEQLGNDASTAFKSMYTALIGSTKATGGKLSKMDFTAIGQQLYTGKAIKPAVTIMDGGYTLKKGTDYTVTYKNNKKIGKATVTIKGKGKYTGTVKKTFSIVAIKTSDIATFSIKMAEVVNKNVYLSWNNYGSGEYDSIQVLRAAKKNGTYKAIATLKKPTDSQTSLTGYVDKTAKGKTYYYALRAVVKVKGKNYKGSVANKVQAEKTTADWYSGDDGYIRVEKNGSALESFQEYTVNGSLFWNCDWPAYENEDEITWLTKDDDVSHTDKVNYSFSTPADYAENGQDVSVYAYYGEDEFYYIWLQDGYGFKEIYKSLN